MFRSPLTDGIVVIVILLLIVGPKKLPQLGRGLGDGMREFKEGITGEGKPDEKPEITPATQMPEPARSERPEQAAAVPPSESGGTERQA